MAPCTALCQAPTGTITGVATDPAGSPLVGVRIIVTSHTSGLARHLTTSNDGAYTAVALLPGAYRLAAQSEGFGALERSALVEAGTTTTINLPFELTGLTENVTVRDIAPLIRYDHHQVTGIVTRNQIENLPLNGRNFLELAKLEPGAQPITRASSNRTFVPILGQPGGNSGRGTRVTVDGGSIMAVGNGGAAMAFSQELVQEFQVTSVNLDLSTGLTSGAAINVATRSRRYAVPRHGHLLLSRSQSLSISRAQSRSN